LSEATGNTIEPTSGPARVGDVRYFWLDCSRAKRALGWEPEVSFEDGVRLTVESFR
jgi:UDP-glucose 4-epimerase